MYTKPTSHIIIHSGATPSFGTRYKLRCASKTNDEGYQLWPKEFNIARSQLVACFIYLRAGIIVGDRHSLASTFHILGGCDQLDAQLRDEEHAAQEAENRRLQNPSSPQDDENNLFEWRVSFPSSNGQEIDDGWSVTAIADSRGRYWLRRLHNTE